MGSEVIFRLKTGDKISGILDTIGREYTILVDMIGGWDVLNNDEKESKTPLEEDGPKPVSIVVI